ncbi:hypothetical protein OG216_46825 (plasmid) [Streptomycetaceae bacterium NBC_01309]
MTEHTPTTGALVPRNTSRVLEGAVELSAERIPDPGASMVWVQTAAGSALIPKESLPPEFFDPTLLAAYQPRDLAPQPVVDPMAQRIVAGGVAVGAAGAGVGWGMGQALMGIAAFSGSGTVLGMLLGLLFARALGPSTTVHHHETHVTHRSLLARSSVTTSGGAR